MHSTHFIYGFMVLDHSDSGLVCTVLHLSTNSIQEQVFKRFSNRFKTTALFSLSSAPSASIGFPLSVYLSGPLPHVQYHITK